MVLVSTYLATNQLWLGTPDLVNQNEERAVARPVAGLNEICNVLQLDLLQDRYSSCSPCESTKNAK